MSPEMSQVSVCMYKFVLVRVCVCKCIENVQCVSEYVSLCVRERV